MPSTPLAMARTLGPLIRDAADTTERSRRVPPALVAELAAAGLFGLCVPRALGGEETDVGTLAETIAAVAEADGSTGWVVMIAATTGVLAAYLPTGAAREIYDGGGRVITGGVFAPQGTATPEAGGYRVRGRWSFASGCQHAHWLAGGCRIVGEPRTPPRMMLLPASEVEIIDTWTVSGLCGTGSHDIAIHDRFIPAARSVSLVTDQPQHDGTLYRFPVFGLLALGIAAVALGIARRAIDELTVLAGEKVPTLSQRRLAERSAVQADVARAEAALGAARAYLLERIGSATAAAERGTITAAERARLRLAASHATTQAAAVVDRMYEAAGGSAIYASSPLQRCFRDIHAATQHAMVAAGSWELAGRVLLGLDTDVAML